MLTSAVGAWKLAPRISTTPAASSTKSVAPQDAPTGVCSVVRVAFWSTIWMRSTLSLKLTVRSAPAEVNTSWWWFN